MLDHLVNVDLGQADDDLEGSEEELEVAGREWKRMEERSLKEGFRSVAVFLPLLIFKSKKGLIVYPAMNEVSMIIAFNFIL